MLGLGCAVLAVYALSLCPDVYTIDSGELATVSYTLGIAHPTGYPLYTLISYLFAHLPGEPISGLNFLSALLSTCAAIFIYAIAQRVTKSRTTPFLVASLYAFSPIIWRSSVTNEVHPLTGMLACLLLFLLLDLGTDRRFFLFMYVCGLCFTNHMMAFALVVPAVVYAVTVHRLSSRRILTGLAFFGLGLSLYAYIITRTLGGAEFAWGNAVNLERLFWHVTGKQYQVWMFSQSASGIVKNFFSGMKLILGNFLYVLIIPSAFGFYVLFKKDRPRFWLLVAAFGLNILYTINYSIPDIEAYYIPSVIVLILGLAYAMTSFKRLLKPPVVLAAALLIPVLNYRSCTLRDNHFGMDFARSHAASLPDSSLLIATYWDIYAPLLYLREVKNERTDLIIIDKELLRRTWYLKYLEQEYPDLFASIRPHVEAYLVELEKFEYGRPYLAQAIQTRYIRMLESFVDARLGKGVYFAAPWPDMDLNAVRPAYVRSPYGLVYRLDPDDVGPAFDFSRFGLTRPKIVNDTRVEYNLGIVRRMLAENADHLSRTGFLEEAATARGLIASF